MFGDRGSNSSARSSHSCASSNRPKGVRHEVAYLAFASAYPGLSSMQRRNSASHRAVFQFQAFSITRAVKITPRTLYRWQQDPEFDKVFRKARRDAFGQGTARLQQSASAAVSTVLKVMVDQHTQPSTKLRAADLVLTHGAKAIEIEDIEARVAELERAAEEAKKTR